MAAKLNIEKSGMYKSAERKISQKSPEYIYVKLLIAM
jgi:hypothetical protein